MQNTGDLSLDIYTIFREEELDDISLDLKRGDRIFFIGDLGTGKTTFIRSILRRFYADRDMIIRSPTYTYYQKYGENIYHFDLYRLDVFQNFDSIGGGDIFDDEKNICLIEWPEILTVHYLATKTIHITLLDDGSRRIEIRTHRVPAIEGM